MSGLEPPAKRARVDLPDTKVKPGDLLEGAGMALLVETIVVIDAHKGIADVEASVACGVGATLSLFKVRGTYDVCKHHMTLLPTCTIEGSVTFTVEGKFDARFNSPVFVLASHKVEEQVSPRGWA